MQKNTPKQVQDHIYKTIKKHKIIRRKELLELLQKKPLCGIATYQRHLSKMEQHYIIKCIKHPETTKHGIMDKDKKASYFMLEADAEAAEFYNEVIKALTSKNPRIYKTALTEIEAMSTVKLTPEQLTNLSKVLTKQDELICYQIACILRDHIDRRIFPSDPAKFQEHIITCFKKHQQIQNPKNRNLRAHLLRLLGVYENPIIIDFLEQELTALKPTHNPEPLIHEYSLWEVAPTIQKHRKQLFILSHCVSPEQSQIIFRIRTKATDYLNIYKKNLHNLKTARIASEKTQ